MYKLSSFKEIGQITTHTPIDMILFKMVKDNLETSYAASIEAENNSTTLANRSLILYEFKDVSLP